MSTLTLGEIVDIRKGRKPATTIDHHDLTSQPCILIDEVRGKAPTVFTLDSNGVDARLDDLCIVWDGANAGTVGFGVQGYLGSTVARLRIKDRGRWDTKFLGRLLQGQFAPINKAAHGKGATIPHVDKRQLEELQIPAYPIVAQKRIAAILDQGDELRRKRQRSIDRLNQLSQAIFYEMFGDPTTNPKAWPTAKASALAKRITVGLVVKPASYYQESGVPAIRGTNIKETGIDLSDLVYFSERDNETKLSKSRIWADDIVIVRSGRPGLAAIVPPKLNGVNAIDVLIFTPNRKATTPRFIRDLINSEGGKRLVLSQSRGQVQQHFNVGSLSDADFFLPPISLQQEYEDRIVDLEISKQTYYSTLESAAALFEALQHQAFRGEL